MDILLVRGSQSVAIRQLGRASDARIDRSTDVNLKITGVTAAAAISVTLPSASDTLIIDQEQDGAATRSGPVPQECSE